MSNLAALPAHFIQIANFLPLARRTSATRGVRGDIELLWQVRNSVRDLVTETARLLPFIAAHEPLPDVLFHNQLMFVSQRFREAVEPWLRDFEFIPAELELWNGDPETDLGGGPIVDGYWWLNSWRRLDVVDWRNTEAWLFDPFREGFSYPHTPVKATAFQDLALAQQIPTDEHFFGLLGVEGEHRYLSPALHAHLLNQNLRIKFEPKLWRYGSLRAGDGESFAQLLNPA